MKYLEAEYRLAQTSADDYGAACSTYGFTKLEHDLGDTLRILLEGEDPQLPHLVLGVADQIHKAYKGGGLYAMTFAIGITAIRRSNPQDKVGPVELTDWDQVIARDGAIARRPGVTTLEAIGGMGLLEIGDVNQGYVDGYQAFFGPTSSLGESSGVTGLAALHAHDFMHIASQRTV